MARAHGSSKAKTRREEEVMLLHHDDEQRSMRLRTPMRPKGYGDVTPSASLPPLNDVPASLSARRLAAGGRTLWGRVTAKRHRILGDEDETMPFHCEESTTTKTVPFRRNPPGAWGFGPRALSFVGYDETASCPPHFAPATRRPMRAAPQGSATGCSHLARRRRNAGHQTSASGCYR